MLKEFDLENILSENLEIIFENEDNERDMQIVGRQMFDANNKRSDLVALSDDGSLVVIELKRFAKDIMNREENFAMQAVRYAASLATIQSVEDLIEISYIPYLKKYSPIENMFKKIIVKLIEVKLKKAFITCLVRILMRTYLIINKK